MNIKEQIRERLGSKVLDWKESSARRIYLSVDKKDIFETIRFLFKDMGLRFITASGVDTPNGFEMIYHLSFDRSGELFSVRVFISDKKNPEVDSITPLFAGAEWIEREIWELFGIDFKNHPNLKRLLLAEDWPQGEYPMRQKNEP